MVTLIISEKPKASERIANALADGTVEKKKSGKAIWFEIEINGEKHLVVPAVGHLFTLKQKNNEKWTYPIFETKWVPSFEASKSSSFSKPYFSSASISQYVWGTNFLISSSFLAIIFNVGP